MRKSATQPVRTALATLILALGTGCASTFPLDRDAEPLVWNRAGVPVPEARPDPVARTRAEELQEPGGPQPQAAPASAVDVNGTSLQESYQRLLAQEPASVSGPHKANLMLGYTTERSGGGVTVGLQYEYKMHEKFGIGGLIDLVFSNKFSSVFAAAFYYHPAERWSLLAAPGIEYFWSGSRFITRVGGSYEFPIKGGFTLAPAVYVDLFARDKTPVFLGAYISRRF